MATQEIKDLLLEAGPFARLSATEQRFRLVRYYQPWFSTGWRPDTINNIRATQRLVTHAKALAAPVGTILLVILEEAAAPECNTSAELGTTQQGSRGLMNVEAGPATYFEEEPAETVPDEADMVVTVGDARALQADDLVVSTSADLQDVGPTPEPMADVPTLPAPSGPKARSKRAK